MTTAPKLHAGNPIQWGRDKLPRMRTWEPPAGKGRYPTVGATLREFVPIVLPGIPWQAIAGFAANGEYPWANTTEAVKAQPFHEMGLMGTEGGARAKPCPDPDRNGRYNSYGKLHDHADVRECLGGRSATMVRNAWKTAIADQLAVGLVDIRSDGRELAALLDPRIRPVSEASTWFVALAFSSWSAGAAGAAKHIRPHASALAVVDESARWGTLIRLVAAGPARPKGHSNPAYTVARTWQKLEAGRLLGDETGPTCSAWFDYGLGADHAALCAEIARKGYGAAWRTLIG